MVAEDSLPKKIPVVFFRTPAGSEPVLIARAMEVAGGEGAGCPIGSWLWEVRTDLPTKRSARVLLCFYRERLVALHGFTKKNAGHAG